MTNIEMRKISLDLLCPVCFCFVFLCTVCFCSVFLCNVWCPCGCTLYSLHCLWLCLLMSYIIWVWDVLQKNVTECCKLTQSVWLSQCGREYFQRWALLATHWRSSSAVQMMSSTSSWVSNIIQYKTNNTMFSTIQQYNYCEVSVHLHQVHSSHIHANHKTLNYNNSKQTSPGKKNHS